MVGDLVPYEEIKEGCTKALRWVLYDDEISDYEIPW